jgi:hypothetical protein
MATLRRIIVIAFSLNVFFLSFTYAVESGVQSSNINVRDSSSVSKTSTTSEIDTSTKNSNNEKTRKKNVKKVILFSVLAVSAFCAAIFMWWWIPGGTLK